MSRPYSVMIASYKIYFASCLSHCLDDVDGGDKIVNWGFIVLMMSVKTQAYTNLFVYQWVTFHTFQNHAFFIICTLLRAEKWISVQNMNLFCC